jgi:CHAT domain-containing protein
VLSVPSAPRDGQDDGILQAWEIIDKMRLNADLVTLSACETGLGRDEGGEGLVGLARAFQYARARSVLASLRAVGDESTAELMRRFYTHLKAGRAKADALRLAQIEMIATAGAAGTGGDRGVGATRPLRGARSAPFRWAAFELVGDWR